MSIAIERTIRPSRLTPLLDWLRHARVALSLPRRYHEILSDKDLADIGSAQQDMVRAVDHGVQRPDLLALGWREPRRPTRR